ncbi:TPA: 1-(5-phosphoribosyl)-5-[(5-phosphoribosylamino)methylideneamino]imidazole-4-carboxamide isomerase [Candidatus Poribacteria bacterium]|nr:1-(5-phosphoribosyl)-5-[(5-phosphoribosylamino)methylideneamino]imidazole-4-carboxamide isomerase [Candidatus Poribacteria bacterium]
MLIIPAIDIRNGKCVRLIQGKADAETIFSDDPVAMALKWEDKGAEFLHIVDLDGAFSGEPKNLDIVEKIAKSVSIPIELGGGIRDESSIDKVFQAGVYRVILGTSALKNPDFVSEMCDLYDEKIAVGIDAKDGKVAIKGWTEIEGKIAVDLAVEMKECGVKTIIYTDISRDGMLTGPNIQATKNLAVAVSGVSIIASGGVSSIEDIKKIKELEPYGVTGVIIGKALYTGNIQLEEAIIL